MAGGVLLAAMASGGLAQAPRQHRIAVVLPGQESGFRSLVQAFRAALKNLGYVEGRDLILDFRWAEDRTDQLPRLASEAVASKPDVIVTATSGAVGACKRATSSIPIVFATVANPVEQGFVGSLQRPGGNITGVLVYGDLTQKLLEVAREAFPEATRFAVLVHEADPVHKLVLESYALGARHFKLEPVVVRVAHSQDLDRAFSELAGKKADVLLLPQLAFITSHHAELIERSLKARLPTVSGQIFIAERGGLLSYGVRIEENYERAAVIVDKILRGARPAEMAVEQPQRFQLVLNRRTAQAIGAKVSSLTTLRADRIVE
jgi:putative tryptophan/tyrosine transport system substrate-binding protein